MGNARTDLSRYLWPLDVAPFRFSERGQAATLTELTDDELIGRRRLATLRLRELWAELSEPERSRVRRAARAAGVEGPPER